MSWKVEQIEKGMRRATETKRFLKKRKIRAERREARMDPECEEHYGRYYG